MGKKTERIKRLLKCVTSVLAEGDMGELLGKYEQVSDTFVILGLSLQSSS